MTHTMSSSAKSALAIPAAQGWDYGDFPYGLEPLTLPHPHPHPHHAAVPSGRLERSSVEDAWLTFLDGAGTPQLTEPAAEDQLERLFWFRWITGHQISFIIWRLLAAALERVGDDDGDRHELATAVTQYVRGYSAMLLYTSSCTKAVYTTMIRPSMYRVHKTFSGTWAPDYPPVRGLFHGRKIPPVPAGRLDELLGEIRLTQRVHYGVAAKLVDGARSLMQRSFEEGGGKLPPRPWGSIFDCYFLTLRAPVSAQEIAVQLLRRQKAAAMDLATNGLYPVDTPGRDEFPPPLLKPDVTACGDDIAGIMYRVGGLAAGLPPDVVCSPQAVAWAGRA
jgi:L-tyrosine peroxygenase